MKLLQITNAYPYTENPIYGIFIKEQLDSIKTYADFDLVFINGKKGGLKAYFYAFLKLRKMIKRYDVIHCHHAFTAIIVLLLRKDQKVIVSILSDGSKDFRFNNFFILHVSKILYRYILKKSDARIFKKEIPKEFQKDKFSYYLPNGVNTNFFTPIEKTVARKALSLDEKGIYLLFVSLGNQNRPEKRYHVFHKACEILKNEYHIIINELILVNTERALVPYFFNSANIHVLTSAFEGSPNSIKESMACNTPIVSTNVGNVKAMIGESKYGVICDNNAASIARGILKILNQHGSINLRDQLISNKLDMDSVAQSLIKIYHDAYREE